MFRYVVLLGAMASLTAVSFAQSPRRKHADPDESGVLPKIAKVKGRIALATKAAPVGTSVARFQKGSPGTVSLKVKLSPVVSRKAKPKPGGPQKVKPVPAVPAPDITRLALRPSLPTRPKVPGPVKKDDSEVEKLKKQEKLLQDQLRQAREQRDLERQRRLEDMIRALIAQRVAFEKGLAAASASSPSSNPEPTGTAPRNPDPDGPADPAPADPAPADPAPADPAPADAEAAEPRLPLQREKYLVIRNDTDSQLTVFVQLEGSKTPLKLVLEAGEQSPVFDKDDEKVAASDAFIWAESKAGAKYDTYKKDSLALCEAPYRAKSRERFLFTFKE